MICVSLFLFCFVVLLNAVPTEDVTLEKVQRAREKIDMVLGLRAQRQLVECEGFCVPKLVRFAFHMCVGGCDGCLNFNQGSNKGLGGIGTLLNQIYEGPDVAISSFLTRADFWALAVDEGAVVATENQQFREKVLFKSTWEWGRSDCPTSPMLRVELDFPEARDTCRDSVEKFLRSDMGLSAAEMVAVIGGGHALGQARVANSGYRGPWAPPIEAMGNGYFKMFTQQNYQHMQHSDGHFAWSLRSGHMMLNTDMCMYKAIDNHISSDGTLVMCARNPIFCISGAYPNHPTYHPLIRQFASDANAWMASFQTGWKKMNSHRNTNLREACPQAQQGCRRTY